MGIENTYDFRGFLGIKSVLCYKDLNCKIEVDKGTTTNVKNTDITIKFPISYVQSMRQSEISHHYLFVGLIFVASKPKRLYNCPYSFST